MKFILKPLIWLMLLLCKQAMACDVCGNYMGIANYQNKNSISFLHRYRVFNGYRNHQTTSKFFPSSAYKTTHENHSADSGIVVTNNYLSSDFESYKVFELRLKYFVAKKIELNLFAPVLNNKYRANNVYVSNTGFGDVSFNAGYHIIQLNNEKLFKHKLVYGIGFKMPTGNCNRKTTNNERLMLEMQCGTGSWDFFNYINYLAIYKNFGVNTNVNYKLNTKNKHNERIANSITNFASIFYQLKVKSVLLYPSLQSNYEFTKGVVINNSLQKHSKINSLLLGPGIDVYYKNVAFNFAWQFTAHEKTYANELQSAGRLVIGFNYLFK